MTQRSMLAGHISDIVIRAGGSVKVEGWDSDRVQADADNRWGLKIEQRSEREIGRARAKVGEHVLFDVRLKTPSLSKKDAQREVIEVQFGADGAVNVPLNSNVKVYAGKSIDVRNIRGQVAVFAGRDIHLQSVHVLTHASAGGSMYLDCDRLEGDDFKFTSGRDLRFCIRELKHATLLIDDLGGYWEAVLGDGRTRIRLKAGGDATLVTDGEVQSQPPHYMLGRIEKPNELADEK